MENGFWYVTKAPRKVLIKRLPVLGYWNPYKTLYYVDNDSNHLVQRGLFANLWEKKTEDDLYSVGMWP